MQISKITKEQIENAIKYIDQHDVPKDIKSIKYDLVADNGNSYPPKYVVAEAITLETGEKVSTGELNTGSVLNLLRKRGYSLVEKQVKYELTITADNVVSTDDRFNPNDLSLGDNCEAIDVYYQKSNGDKVYRKVNKGEYKISGLTMPRLICQVFEDNLNRLNETERENFPISKKKSNKLVTGIFSSISEYKIQRDTMYMMYTKENGPTFVFHNWNLFTTITFVQECLKRWDREGKIVLTYRDKAEKNKVQETQEKAIAEDISKTTRESNYRYSKILLESKNIIFRGAPGTGKTHLAWAIAADIISNGYTDQYDELTDDQREQVEFVQFHPSYDYTDFVEGLRPVKNEDDVLHFELQDGIFKSFVNRARKNYEDSFKSQETIEREVSIQEAMESFFSEALEKTDPYKIGSGNEFVITDISDGYIRIDIPNNPSSNKVNIRVDEIQRMLEANEEFNHVSDITRFLNIGRKQRFSYDLAIYNEIKRIQAEQSRIVVKKQELKKYIFIIDEINRGEISKIMGELFFSIDPGYRGKDGEVSTKYQNMHPTEKFYVPENVYIIGTMNDIDRSVDSFDFAMRRRFRFIEINVEEFSGMLEKIEDEEKIDEAIRRMERLNAAIVNRGRLNENYQIGPAYFLKLKTMSFDELWTDSLEPLLQEYVRGLYDEKDIMDSFAKAYGYIKATESDSNEN